MPFEQLAEQSLDVLLKDVDASSDQVVPADSENTSTDDSAAETGKSNE